MIKKPVFLLSLFILLLLASSSAYAQNSGHLKLLAVTEDEFGNLSGSPADLYLEVIPGTGRVFLDTFPFAKLDTQMSTRFANKIACDFLNYDCSNIDFIYTIKANSVIIGGPSAGAAISVLTVAVLDDLKIDEDVAISGTINSGGLIGPVGGLKEKIDGASKAKIKKVLIPFGESMSEEELVIDPDKIVDIINITETINETNATTQSQATNRSIDLVEYGKEKNVIVQEASTIYEAIFQITGKQYKIDDSEIIRSVEYEKVMGNIAQTMCNRTKILFKNVPYEKTQNNSIYDDAVNLTSRANYSLMQNDFYSSASFCFGANIKFKYLSLNKTKEELLHDASILNQTIQKKLEELNSRKLSTINDLQTMIIVSDRIDEAQGYVDGIYLMQKDFEEMEQKFNASNFSVQNTSILLIELNLTDESTGKQLSELSEDELKELIFREGLKKVDERLLDTIKYNLAYGTERMNSALSWAGFFNSGGKNYEMDKYSLKKACITSISETQERYQYVKVFYPEDPNKIKEEIDKAQKELREEKFELCLFSSSKAKAGADIMLSAVGVSESKIEELINQKLGIVKRTIAKQQRMGVFPILGYSYYEYSNSLRPHDKVSSLLYAGYALEMSNLDLYFNEKKGSPKILNPQQTLWIIFAIGIIIGSCVSWVIFNFVKNKSRFSIKSKGSLSKRSKKIKK